MEAMIEGVLQYSRAGRLGAEPEEVDVGALVGETLELLQPSPRATVETGDLPVLVAERAPLAQVLLNLIGNALKHARREDPIVRVTAEPEGEWWRFSVADNGPGIEPRYHDRIWTMFQTLSARDEHESTGIGLSVVRKVVEDQGGRVWVESDPAKGPGATFHVIWPARPEVGRAADWAPTRSPGHRGGSRG
jgi:signal transduction histidine kinase